MRNDKSVTLRVSQQLVKRTDALRKLLEKDPEVGGVYGPPSRATLWRLAILRGLEVLEKKYAPGWELDESSAELDVPEELREAVPVNDGQPLPPSSDPVLAEAFGTDPPDAFPTMFDGLGSDGSASASASPGEAPPPSTADDTVEPESGSGADDPFGGATL